MTNFEKQKKNKRTKLIWSAVGIIIVLVLLFFARSDETASTISIAPPGAPATVYIDRSTVSPITSTTSPATYNVSPGSKQVLVARDGYWPWSQRVDVPEDETVELRPFLIEESGRRVLQTTNEITAALSEAQTQSPPTADAPVMSPSGDIRTYVDSETNIIAQWTAGTSSAPAYFDCHEGTCGVSVFNQAPVRQIDFYPDRDDVIFFATDTGVYAIDVNPRDETQNFQPVVEGVRNPVFTISDGNIFVLSGERITVSDI